MNIPAIFHEYTTNIPYYIPILSPLYPQFGGVGLERPRLFQHLRNSKCTASAAADGLEIKRPTERVALVLGVDRASRDSGRTLEGGVMVYPQIHDT